MNPDYQFDDPDKTLPVWKVKHEDMNARNARLPFFKQTAFARASNRKDAILKVKNYFPNHDRFTASKI